MANKKAVLTKYIRVKQGWRYARVTLHKNGTVKGVLIGGQERPIGQYPEGQYQVKTYVGSSPVYCSVGNHPVEAVRQWRLTQLSMSNPDLEIQPPVRGAKTIAEWGREFLAKKDLEPHRSRHTMEKYKGIVEAVTKQFGQKTAEALTETDVLRYHKSLRERGLSDRTASNSYIMLVTFLRFCKVDVNSLLPRETRKKLSRYVKKEVDIYTPAEVDRLIAVSSDYYKLVWYFLYKTGFRMQEAMYLEWVDVDFTHNTVSVRSKPGLGFEPKDSEERSVPLINGLGDRLRDWRTKNPTTRFVFGTRSDQPNGHWLEYLKDAAKEAGMDPDACRLHMFRATYCTTALRSGLDLPTVQRLMGHSDLASTMRYLKPQTNEDVRDRLNTAFTV
jgi:integrase/recombinase XerD